ncbi:hypothetical protein HMI55_001662 [Coelomomyces lativittatus]|nr:hypothetical protein HMI55_001662 [Coelomomyces lativittatus]
MQTEAISQFSTLSQTDQRNKLISSSGFQTEPACSSLTSSMQTVSIPQHSTAIEADCKNMHISSTVLQAESQSQLPLTSIHIKPKTLLELFPTLISQIPTSPIEVVDSSSFTSSIQAGTKFNGNNSTESQTETNIRIPSLSMDKETYHQVPILTQTDNDSKCISSPGFQTESNIISPTLPIWAEVKLKSSTFVQTDDQTIPLDSSAFQKEDKKQVNTFSMQTEAEQQFSSLTQTDIHSKHIISSGVQTKAPSKISTWKPIDDQLKQSNSSILLGRSDSQLPSTSSIQTEALPRPPSFQQTDFHTERDIFPELRERSSSDSTASWIKSKKNTCLSTFIQTDSPSKWVSSSGLQTDSNQLATFSTQTEKYAQFSTLMQTDIESEYHTSSGFQTDQTHLGTTSIQTDRYSQVSSLTQTHDHTKGIISLGLQTNLNPLSTSSIQTEAHPLISCLTQTDVQHKDFVSSDSQTEASSNTAATSINANSNLHHISRMNSIYSLNSNPHLPILKLAAGSHTTSAQTEMNFSTSVSLQTDNYIQNSSSSVSMQSLNNPSNVRKTLVEHLSTSPVQTELINSNSTGTQTFLISSVFPTTLQTESVVDPSFAVEAYSTPQFSLSTQYEKTPTARCASTSIVQTETPAQISISIQTSPLVSSNSHLTNGQVDFPTERNVIKNKSNIKSFIQHSLPPVQVGLESQVPLAKQSNEIPSMTRNLQTQIQSEEAQAPCQNQQNFVSQSSSIQDLWPFIQSIGTPMVEMKEKPVLVSTETQVAISAVDDGVKDWIRHQLMARTLTNKLLQTFTQEMVTILALEVIATNKKNLFTHMSVQTNPTSFSTSVQSSTIGTQVDKPTSLDFIPPTQHITTATAATSTANTATLDHGIQVSTLPILGSNISLIEESNVNSHPTSIVKYPLSQNLHSSTIFMNSFQQTDHPITTTHSTQQTDHPISVSHLSIHRILPSQ